MNAIMMYMSGNSLQIFSIMMVFMLFKGPIQGLMNTNAMFSKLETDATRAKLVGVKLVYVLMQLVLLGLGVWKVNGMGLLPYVYFSFYSVVAVYVVGLNIYLVLQNYEVGLVGVGSGTRTVGEGTICVWMRDGKILLTSLRPFAFRSLTGTMKTVVYDL